MTTEPVPEVNTASIGKPAKVRAARAIGGTVAAYAVSQLVIGFAALYRVPLLVGALKPAGFGLFMVVLGLWPWLNAGWDAVRQGARVRVAEAPLARAGRTGAVADVRRGALLVAGASLCLSGAVGWLLGALHVSDRAQVSNMAAFLACMALGTVAAFGGSFAANAGRLEALGETAKVNLSYSLTAIVGLPLLVIAISVGASFDVLVLVAGVGYLIPFLALWGWGGGSDHGVARQSSPGEGTKTVGKMAIWSVTGVLGSGIDTLAVAIFLGPATAGVYAVVQRVLALALTLPTSLGGYVTSYFTRMRQRECPSAVATAVRRAMILYAVAGALTALLFMMVAPASVRLLTHGKLHAPQSLYFAMAAVIFTQFLTSPLLASLTSPEGLKTRNRVVVVASLLNVLLTFVLASVLGAAGPALATATAGVFIATLATRQVERRTEVLFASN